MKRKDLIYLSVAVGILMVAAMLLFNGGSSTQKGAPTVEVIAPIDASYDQPILVEIADSGRHRNFAVPVDLKTELGNKRPFGR